jgi:metal-responsive CopG/Arc/MetJ family transcriptional regulator
MAHIVNKYVEIKKWKKKEDDHWSLVTCFQTEKLQSSENYVKLQHKFLNLIIIYPVWIN